MRTGLNTITKPAVNIYLITANINVDDVALLRWSLCVNIGGSERDNPECNFECCGDGAQGRDDE